MPHSLWVEFYPGESLDFLPIFAPAGYFTGGFPLFRIVPGVMTCRKKCETDVFKR
jgi:hypothetical protein